MTHVQVENTTWHREGDKENCKLFVRAEPFWSHWSLGGKGNPRKIQAMYETDVDKSTKRLQGPGSQPKEGGGGGGRGALGLLSPEA